jgi:hypothetical protein
MSMEKPLTIQPDDPKGFRIPKPKIERGGNPFKSEIKREGGRLVIRTSKRSE